MICIFFGVCFRTSGPPDKQVSFDKYRSLVTKFWCFGTLVICVFSGVCFWTSGLPNIQVSFDKYTGKF